MANDIDRLHVKTLSAGRFTPPAGCIGDDAIRADAAIDADKLRHRFQPAYAQNGNADAAADRRVVHVVHGAAAELLGVQVGTRTACTGDSTVTVNVYVNGVSVLSAPVVLDNTNAAYALEAGTVSSPDLEADDVVEVGVTVSAGTGTLGDGVFCVLQIDEDAN